MSVVITGTNRGIGLALVKAYLARGTEVIATARQPNEARELQALASDKLRILALDISSDDSVAEFSRELGDISVDLLINNAGSGGDYSKHDDPSEIIKVFNTNAVGPLRVTKALLARMPKRTAKILHITSQMGSIDDNSSGGAYAYRMSKAALNMMGKSLAVDLSGRGIVSIIVHPGWVQTDMGGRSAPTTVEQCASNIVALADRATLEMTGKFFHADGRQLPW